MFSTEFWLLSPLFAAIAISIGIIVYIDQNTKAVEQERAQQISKRSATRSSVESPSPITTSDTAALINRRGRRAAAESEGDDEPVPDSPAQRREVDSDSSSPSPHAPGSDSGSGPGSDSDGDSDVAPDLRGESVDDEFDWDHVKHSDAEMEESDKPLAQQKIVIEATMDAKKFIDKLRRHQDSNDPLLDILRDFSAHFARLTIEHSSVQVRSALSVAVCNGLIESDGLNLLNSISSNPNTDPDTAAEAKKLVETVVPLVWQK